MPLTVSNLIATVGAANANSYVTLAEAQTYHDLNLGSDAWFEAEEGDQIRALIKAARRLQQETWLGSRVDSTQALAWPRAGVAKIDAVVGWGGVGWDYSGWSTSGDWREQYLPDEIPQQVKDAQCELALAYLNGAQSTGESNGTIRRWKADDVEIEYAQSPTGQPGSLAPNALQLIAPLVAGARLVRG